MAADAAVRAVARVPRAAQAMNLVSRFAYRFLPGGERECPICDHVGHFAPTTGQYGVRPHARCPRCGALERHRLQANVLRNTEFDFVRRGARVLHVAPEPQIAGLLVDAIGPSGEYVSADLHRSGVDLRLDLRDMRELDSDAWDLVWASHVLEHIDDDRAAIRETHRILRPGGRAVLPVPIVADRTTEYRSPSAAEHGHVRAPGLDYLERYRDVFASVTTFRSRDAPSRYQTWIFEDRTIFPTASIPDRPAQSGSRHEDVVPICHKAEV